jgi:RNA exonuclease 4
MHVSPNWKALQARLKAKVADPASPPKAKEIWFEVDERDLERSRLEANPPASLLELFPRTSNDTKGKYVAMDCEYVGVGPGGVQSALARITLVNWHGAVLYDTFVRSPCPVTDYRTEVSGVRPENLVSAPDHQQVLTRLEELVTKDTVLVGHGLKNDMRVLMWSHPRRMVRDTSTFHRFRALSRGRTPALRRLAKQILGVGIQKGEHDSAEDARAAMLLYKKYKNEWESCLSGQEGEAAANRAGKYKSKE